MPILTLQQSMRRLGRIRMGAKGAAKKGNRTVEFPKKLETWRMTSASRDLLEAAAAIYGGDVTEWEGAPSGKQWELFTEADVIDIVIPPGDMAFSQWFELWSGGGCQRRCDGDTEQLSDSPCMCPADPEARIEAAKEGKACKPTSRLFVIQPHLPDVGLWHFESHGFYAATELPGTINIIRAAAAAGTLIPARLRIEQRTSKTGTETLRYAVPVIELPTLTPHTLMTGEVTGGRLPSGAPAQLAAPQAAIAAAQAPVERPSVTEQLDAALAKGQSGEARLMGTVNDQIKRAAVSSPAPGGDVPEDRRPLPAAGSGDGSAMRRAILAKAKKIGVDAEGLDAVCRGRIGKNFAEITSADEANGVLAALDGVPA